MNFLIFLLLIFSMNTIAQVSVAPTMFSSGADQKSSEINIMNDGTTPIMYEISLEGDSDKMNQNIRFSPKRVRIEPKSYQRVRAIIKRTGLEKGPHLHYVRLKSITDPTTFKPNEISIQQSFVVPIYFAVGTEDIGVDFKSLKVEKTIVDVPVKSNDKKNKQTKKEEGLSFTVSYENLKRTPMRFKAYVWDIENKKSVYERDVVLKEPNGSVELKDVILKENSKKLSFVIKQFKGEKILFEKKLND